ncbi:MAG: hypothetical protein ACI4F9_06095 [Lachnospiraceae bacterium]
MDIIRQRKKWGTFFLNDSEASKDFNCTSFAAGALSERSEFAGAA